MATDAGAGGDVVARAFDSLTGGMSISSLEQFIAELGDDVSLGEVIEKIGEGEKTRIWQNIQSEVERLNGVVDVRLQEARARQQASS
mmetsp:Transcript_50899/g.134489  ORF Transcript_50899/g.134489 Transcript_50899/m.134489 type:complete len:87 (+) Transcript_50899:81-341(+)